MIPRRSISAFAVALLVLSACGGGSDDAAEESGVGGGSADSGDGADGSTGEAGDSNEVTALADDLPQFLSDFDRVCTTETGFGGATPYSDGPGPHPFVLMQESDAGYIFERDLSDAPAGWNIQTDSDFDDNSEIVPTELIACSIRSGTAPTGIMCDLEGDDGSVTTLELVDVTFELKILEATTGAVVATDTIEAVDTECPFFVFVDEGDTQHFNTPTEDQYINAVKAFVAP